MWFKSKINPYWYKFTYWALLWYTKQPSFVWFYLLIAVNFKKLKGNSNKTGKYAKGVHSFLHTLYRSINNFFLLVFWRNVLWSKSKIKKGSYLKLNDFFWTRFYKKRVVKPLMNWKMSMDGALSKNCNFVYSEMEGSFVLHAS